MNQMKRIRSHIVFSIRRLTHKEVYFSCFILIVVALIIIIGTTYYIHIFLQEPKIITGRLDGTEWYYSGTMAVYVNGDRYVLRKETYSKRTFGIIENKKLGDLMKILDGKIGKEVNLECIEINSKTRNIIGLTIDGIDYIDKNVAVSDFIGIEKTIRNIGIVMLVIMTVIFVLTWKGIIV